MIRSILILLFYVISITAYTQDKIDTIYYYKGKSVSNKAFADHYTVRLIPQDSLSAKRFRSYYTDGTMKAEGEYLYIDTHDMSNNIYDGEIINYDQDGNIILITHHKDGKLNGE